MSESVAADWNWVEVGGDSRALPTHSDGVRVILRDSDGRLTHGLASYPERPDTGAEPLHGWKLWYFEPGAGLGHVVAWRELEKLSLMNGKGDNPLTTKSPVAQVPEDQTQQRRRDYRPSPGRVTVIRTKAKQFHNEELGIVTSELEKDREEFFSIYATVARVGDQVPGGIAPWFEAGDVVTILPSMFLEIDLVPGFSVWNGSFAGVTGVFEDPEPEE